MWCIFFCFVVGYCAAAQEVLVPGSKSNFAGNPEARAKHALCGGYVANVVDGSFVLVLWVAWLHDDAKFLGDALADVFERGVIVQLVGKAVYVDHGEFSPRRWLKEGFFPGVDTAVAAEKLDGGGREVHDKVGDGRRNGDVNRFRSRCGEFALGGPLLGYRGVFAVLRSGEYRVGGLVDEGPAVFAERAHEFLNLCCVRDTRIK
jgi:hypothetical protein